MNRIALFTRLVWESFVFSAEALRSNLLRTVLSLLGVTVGIFAIVAVFTVVDALEKSIRQATNFLGDDVMYVQRFPWRFGGGGEYPIWKYLQRPLNKVEDFKFLEKRLEGADAVALMLFKGGMTLKHKNNSIPGALLQGSSMEVPKIRDVLIEQGRYFSNQEMESGKPVTVIGSQIAETLFPYESALGKEIKVKDNKFTVIGIMKKEGKNIFGDTPNDVRMLVPYKAFGKLYVIGRRGVEPVIALKGRPDKDPGLMELEYEARGLLRQARGQKPQEEDNFALNRTELLADAISSLFQVLGVAGWVIGSFSILVGGFGIANIMFVSVKERTNIIGIQKSLGAKNYFILFQFLFEAVFLSLFGGLLGVLLVYLITVIPQDFLAMSLTPGNLLLGMTVSAVVGVLSGVVPALMAARMDPVEAIRSK